MVSKMMETKELPVTPSNTKKIKAILIGAGLFLLVALAILSFGGYLSPPMVDPMKQFVTQKNCSFLVIGDINRAVCTDGTVYEVKQIGSPLAPGQ